MGENLREKIFFFSANTTGFVIVNKIAYRVLLWCPSALFFFSVGRSKPLSLCYFAVLPHFISTYIRKGHFTYGHGIFSDLKWGR